MQRCALGQTGPHSLLITGDSGSGKSLLLLLLAHQHQATVLHIKASMAFEESDRLTLKQFIDRAFYRARLIQACRPVLLLVENCDELVPKQCENEALLLAITSHLEEIGRGGGLRVVIACTSALWPEELNELWRSRIELHFQMPRELDLKSQELLGDFFAEQWGARDASASLLDGIAENRFQLARDISCHVRRKIFDLAAGQAATRTRELGFARIHGQERAKDVLGRCASYLTKEETRLLFAERGIMPPRGVVLYGPPGTGKTSLARALAETLSARFYAVSIPEILHSSVGETEKSLSLFFSEAVRNQPAVVFFDEIDAIAAQQQGTGSSSTAICDQLCEELDRLVPTDMVLCLAATNLPDSLPRSLRRHGRLSTDVWVGPLSGTEVAAVIRDTVRALGLPPLPEEGARIHFPQLSGAQLGEITNRIRLETLFDPPKDSEQLSRQLEETLRAVENKSDGLSQPDTSM